jgi:hypothetical protein
VQPSSHKSCIYFALPSFIFLLLSHAARKRHSPLDYQSLQWRRCCFLFWSCNPGTIVSSFHWSEATGLKRHEPPDHKEQARSPVSSQLQVFEKLHLYGSSASLKILDLAHTNQLSHISTFDCHEVEDEKSIITIDVE